MDTSRKIGRRISRRRVFKGSAAIAGASTFPMFFVKARAAGDPKRLALYKFDGNLGDFYMKNWIGPFIEKMDV